MAGRLRVERYVEPLPLSPPPPPPPPPPPLPALAVKLVTPPPLAPPWLAAGAATAAGALGDALWPLRVALAAAALLAAVYVVAARYYRDNVVPRHTVAIHRDAAGRATSASAAATTWLDVCFGQTDKRKLLYARAHARSHLNGGRLRRIHVTLPMKANVWSLPTRTTHPVIVPPSLPHSPLSSAPPPDTYMHATSQGGSLKKALHVTAVGSAATLSPAAPATSQV